MPPVAHPGLVANPGPGRARRGSAVETREPPVIEELLPVRGCGSTDDRSAGGAVGVG